MNETKKRHNVIVKYVLDTLPNTKLIYEPHPIYK